MALTTAQKLKIKKHLQVTPQDDLVDASIAALEDGSSMESELTTALTKCDTYLAAMETVATNADELTSGGGATFSYERSYEMKRREYDRAVEDLARLMGFSMAPGSGWYVS